MHLQDFITRKIVFSRAAFGPRQTPQGVLNHLKKEVAEVQSAIDEGKILDQIAEEFVDCLFLSLDGVWRAVAASIENAVSPVRTDDITWIVEQKIHDKLNEIECREYPDWRTQPIDGPVEHLREPALDDDGLIPNEASYNNTKPEVDWYVETAPSIPTVSPIVGHYYKDRRGNAFGPIGSSISLDYPYECCHCLRRWASDGHYIKGVAVAAEDLIEDLGMDIPVGIKLYLAS